MLIAFYAATLLVLGFWYGQRHAVAHPQDASARVVQMVRP
jgi:hypothetical protein